MRHLFSLLLVLVAGAAWGAQEKSQVKRTMKSDPSREYHLHLPPNYNPQKTYFVFVALHGMNGNGGFADRYPNILKANKAEAIVVGPTMAWSNGKQQNQAEEIANLDKLVAEIGKEFKTYPKFFLTGYSQGGYFTFDYAGKEPENLIAAVGGGSSKWGTYESKVRAIPIGVYCGMEDAAHYPNARKFGEYLEKEKFETRQVWSPNVGHTIAPEGDKMTVELFMEASTKYATAFAMLEKGDSLVKNNSVQAYMAYRQAFKFSGGTGDLAVKAKAGMEKIEKESNEKLSANKLEAELPDNNKAVVEALNAEDLRQFDGIFRTKSSPYKGTLAEIWFIEAEQVQKGRVLALGYKKKVETSKLTGIPAPDPKALTDQFDLVRGNVEDKELLAILDTHRTALAK